MKKNILLTLIASMCAVCAWAYDFQSGDLYYSIIGGSGSRNIKVTGNPSSLTSVVIPESVIYGGVTYNVVMIEARAFYGCSSLTSLTMGNSVTYIGESAFYGCSGLTSVTIPNSVTYIGESAFENCSGLTSITIGSSVRSIKDNAFRGCSSLTSVVWNAKNMLISKYHSPFHSEYYNIFDLRPQITSFVFGDSVQHIPNDICNGMNNLTSITIGNSVTSIGWEAFSSCTSLTKTNYTGRISDWYKISFEDNPIRYTRNFFINDVLVTDLIIPEEITTINALAYDTCLTSVTIPNSVTSIGGGAFSGCSGLTSITIPNSVTSIGGGAFSDCSGLTSITIPNSVTSIGGGAFSGCSGLTSITIPNSVTSIGGWAFSSCSGLTSITIPNSVTSIGSSAFKKCRSLTSITIPDSITNIENWAFEGCCGLTSVTIPNSVTNISKSAFKGCGGLTSIHIPYSVTSVGDSAFSDCIGLTSVIIPDNVTSIGISTFENCSGLTSITIGSSVRSIKDNAFRGCSSLTSVVWNANCTDFAAYNKTPFCYSSSKYGVDFDLRPQITSFVFGDSVQHIPAYICYEMENLTSVTIGNSVTTIGEKAFYDCSGLTKTNYTGNIADWYSIDFVNEGSIYRSNPVYYSHNFFINDVPVTDLIIPEEITTINDALSYDTCLTSVTIHRGVTSIDGRAFFGCDRLSKTNYTGTIADWYKIHCADEWSNPIHYSRNFFINDVPVTDLIIPEEITTINNALSYDTCLTSVTIHRGVTSIDGRAFFGCDRLSKTNYTGTIADWYKIHFADEWSNPIRYSRNFFINDVLVTDLMILEEITTINNALSYDTCLISVTIPNSVTSIGESAFSYCRNLTSITIPYRVTSIGERAFYDCTALTSLTIPYRVTSIGDNAFYNVPNIVYSGYATGAPWGARSMNGCVDGYLIYADTTKTVLLACSSAATGAITIPNSVEFIEKSAFYGCTGLTKTNYTGTIADWYKINFAGSWSNPVYYSRNFFVNDVLVTDLMIPEEITTINGALSYDTCLTSVTIPNSVTSIGGSAFWCCYGLTSVNIPNSVTSIGGSAFWCCYGLTSITIPSSVTSIGANAFGTSYYFNESRRVYELRSVRFKSITPPNGCGKEHAFRNCNRIETVYIPCGTKADYVAAGWDEGILTEQADIVSVTSADAAKGTALVDLQTSCGSNEAIISATPAEHCHFVQWSDGNTDNPRTVIVTEDVTYTAEFAFDQYTITTSADHGDVSGAGTYDYGTEVTLSATPDTGYHFTQWSDGNANNPRQVVVENDAMFTAEFDIDTYSITVTCDPSEGRVTGSGEYDYGTQVRLEASANSGYEFSQWSNGITDNPYLFTVTEDVTLEASFIPSTAVENTSAEDTKGIQKVLHNGQIYILRNGKVYTITGEEL